MRRSRVANKAGIPWVLDPVFIDRSPPRAAFAKQLLAQEARARSASTAPSSARCPAARPMTRRWRASPRRKRTVVGLTGERDVVRDGARVATIANGDPLMARVTAMGCAASALVGAALAVEPDAWTAVAAALIAIGVAGEVAAARARGPGSFAVEILDALFMRSTAPCWSNEQG